MDDWKSGSLGSPHRLNILLDDWMMMNDWMMVIVIVAMAMKTPAIVKMRPLWKIGRAHFWHCVYMSVFTKRNIHCINCIYTPYSIYACINIQCTQ